MIVATERARRPSDFSRERVPLPAAKICPFDPGNEQKTAPEVLAYRRNGAANQPGWSVRVVPNKFPVLGIEGDLNRQGEGMYDKMNGIGAHEVVIESPEHRCTLAELPENQIEEVMWAYRDRINDLKRDRRFRYIVIFRNHGESAGATLEHPHSQLIALPIVPDFVREEIDGAKQHFAAKERCVFCDIIRQEVTAGKRIIHENADVVALAPYAPRFPFETWLLPRTHYARFEDTPRQVFESLARMLKTLLMRMNKALESPDYNLIIHNSPFSETQANDYYHWHLELMPKLTRTAGFEWGTGFYINPTSPEEAAQVLRSAKA